MSLDCLFCGLPVVCESVFIEISFNSMMPNYGARLSLCLVLASWKPAAENPAPVPPAAAVTTSAAVIAEDQLRHVQLLDSTIQGIFLFTLNKFSVLGGQHTDLVYISSLAEIIGTRT